MEKAPGRDRFAPGNQFRHTLNELISGLYALSASSLGFGNSDGFRADGDVV